MPGEMRVCADPRDKLAVRVDQVVAGRAGEQWGVMSTQELLACGMTRSSMARRRKAGTLHCLFRAVWAVGHPNPPWEGRLLAAVKACGPTAFLSHYSSNELWGFVDRLERTPDVTVIGQGGRRQRGIRVHLAARVDPIDIREHDSIPVSSPPRALLELASMVGPVRTRRAVRRALGTGKITLRQIGLVLDRYPGARGCKVLRNGVASGAAPTKSERESDVLDVILDAGFARPDVNKPLVLQGRRVVPDIRWPQQRLILEIDSRAWHDDPLARADDRERQRLLEAHGETVIRARWLDAVLSPAKTAADLTNAGAPRG